MSFLAWSGDNLRLWGVWNWVRSLCLSVITGDLCATDITMGDEDRKALMMMVKDGALTTEQAMAMVSWSQDNLSLFLSLSPMATVNFKSIRRQNSLSLSLFLSKKKEFWHPYHFAEMGYVQRKCIFTLRSNFLTGEEFRSKLKSSSHKLKWIHFFLWCWQCF